MPGSRLMSTTGPSNPSSRKVAAAVPPVLPPPTITIGFVPVPSDMCSFTLLALIAKTAPAKPYAHRFLLPFPCAFSLAGQQRQAPPAGDGWSGSSRIALAKAGDLGKLFLAQLRPQPAMRGRPQGTP